MSGAGRPIATATGPRIAIAAAWLKSSSESTKSPTANTQGCASTVAEMAPTMAGRFPSKKEDPIHDTPRMEMTAVSPPFITPPLIAFSGSDCASEQEQAGRGQHHDHRRAAHLHLAGLR